MNYIILWHWVGSPGGGVVASTVDEKETAEAICAILREHGSESKVFSLASVKDLCF